MAFTYVGVVPGRTGKLHENETINYLFESDNAGDEAVTLFQHPNCPRYFSKHPQYRWMWAAALSYTQGSNKEWNKWIVTVEYKPIPTQDWPTGEPGPRQPPTREEPNDPEFDNIEDIDFDPHVSFSFEEYSAPVKSAFSPTEAATRAFGVAITGSAAVVKSNLEPYDPAPEKIENDLVINIQRNVPVRDVDIWGKMEQLRNTINTVKMSIADLKIEIPPKCARLRYTAGPRVAFVDLNNLLDPFTFYRALNVQLIVKWATWIGRLKDDGSYAFSVAGTKTIQDRIDTADWDFPVGAEAAPFYDEDDNKIIKLLDGKGNELSGTEPVFNEYKFYREQDHKAFLSKLTNGEVA